MPYLLFIQMAHCRQIEADSVYKNPTGAVAGSFRVYDLIYYLCVEIKINDLDKQICWPFRFHVPTLKQLKLA